MRAIENRVRVAVASKNGVAVDQHFGHAHAFWVYKWDSGIWHLLERREVDHYCQGKGHDGDDQNSKAQTAMSKILLTINDCDQVLVAMIGAGPIAKLAAIGVTANSEYAHQPVADSLAALGQTLSITAAESPVGDIALSTTSHI